MLTRPKRPNPRLRRQPLGARGLLALSLAVTVPGAFTSVPSFRHTLSSAFDVAGTQAGGKLLLVLDKREVITQIILTSDLD